MYLVFEYVEFDLKRILEKGKIVFSRPQLKFLMKQIMDGMLFMHRSQVIHRDIKTENILVNTEGFLKFADFGLARDLIAP